MAPSQDEEVSYILNVLSSFFLSRFCFIFIFSPIPLTLIINYLVILYFSPTIHSKCSHLLWIKESLLNSMIQH